MELQQQSLSLFETSKAERLTFAQGIIQSVIDGKIDPLKAHLQIKCFADLVAMLTETDPKKNKMADHAKVLRGIVVDAAAKIGKTFTHHNAKFDLKEVGTKYDYTVCDDVEWNNMNAEMLVLKEKMTTREKFLQQVPEGGIADPNNGNLIYRAAKSSTTTVQVTLK